MNEHQVHFCRISLASYEELASKQEIDPDTLYFCSVPGKGFNLFLGTLPLTLYTPQQQGGQDQPQQ